MAFYKNLIRSLLSSVLVWACPLTQADDLSLRRAESLALENDQGYEGLMKQSAALKDRAVSDSQLPDPMMSISWMNLPVENFELDKEPMNQFKVGVKQTFPSGDTLDIRKESALADAGRIRQQAVKRRLSVLQQTRSIWLETWYWERAMQTVEENEPLFVQLREVTESFYTTGKKGLDDVVRSELELQRLKDREVKISENIGRQHARLARWIGSRDQQRKVPSELPEWEMDDTDKDLAYESIVRHPLVLAMDQRIEKLRQGVALAREQYKPAWSVEAGYSFRNAERADGTEVPDLASVGASISLPLFTKNRQDKRVSSANHQVNAALDQRLDLLKELRARLDEELIRLDRLNSRLRLHESMILPQSREQAEAALMGYKAERSDFTEVMRAHIDLLESILEYRRIQTDRLKSIAAIRFLVPPENDLNRVLAATSAPGETQ
ncbi:MAG: TolC family protein [Pseudomonadales bacterium]